MYYLDYAKPVGSRYVLNFFADTIEDLKDVPTTTAYVTRNGTTYGVPLDTSVVTIVENGVRVNYVLQNGKYIVGGDIPPIVGTKTIVENGTYLAKDDDLEGYSSVTVEVPETASEEKIVELNMVSGDQTILPEGDKLLDKVVVKKPETLIAENIKDGINIGGVVGGLVTPTNKLPQVVDGSITELTAEDLEGATKLRNGMFSQYSSLTKVAIPGSVISIGNEAFRSCSRLISITIPDSVTSIGSSAFSGCSRLTSVIIPNSVKTVGTNVFYQCGGLANVVIGNGITAISDNMFYICAALTNITIGKSVTSIGNSAFFACTILTNITIPDSVTSIGNGAFNSCEYLKSITIPSNVTSIGGAALKIGNADNKAIITMLPTTPPTVASSTFTAEYLNKIIVPNGTGETYKTATNWAAFADYIEEAAE